MLKHALLRLHGNNCVYLQQAFAFSDNDANNVPEIGGDHNWLICKGLNERRPAVLRAGVANLAPWRLPERPARAQHLRIILDLHFLI